MTEAQRVKALLESLPSVSAPIDRVAWLNHALATQVTHTETGDSSPSLALAHLQTLQEDVIAATTQVSTQINSLIQAATAAVPKATQQSARVTEEVTSLQAEMHALQLTYHELCVPANPDKVAVSTALAHVYDLAQVKARMQRTRDMLQAIDSWPLFEADIQSYVRDAEYEHAAQRLVDATQSLSHFDANDPHVATQQSLIAKLVQQLVDAASPALADAITARDMDRICSMAQVCDLVHEEERVRTIYFQTRAASVLSAWKDRLSSLDTLEAISHLCTHITELLTEETSVYAPALLGGAPYAAELLTYIWHHLEPAWPPYLQQRDTALPDVVNAMQRIRTAATTWTTQLKGSLSTPRLRLDALRDWRDAILLAFVPYQTQYGSLEHACLQRAWADTQSALAARVDRIWVDTLAKDEAPWSNCATQLLTCLHDQVALAEHVQADALHRMYALTNGDGLPAVASGLSEALYPALNRRLASILDTLRTRYRQHAHTSAPPPADILASDDMEERHDWQLVRAAAPLLGVAKAVETVPLGAARIVTSHTRADDVLLGPSALPTQLECDMDNDLVLQAAQRLLLELILTAFRQHLEAYGSHGAWSAPPATVETRVRVPSFSRSPTEGMVHLGEALLNLPRLLEALIEHELSHFAYHVDMLPYAHDDEGATTRSARKSTPRSFSFHDLTQTPAAAAESTTSTTLSSSLDQVLSLWLRSLTRTLLVSFEQDTLPMIVRTPGYDRAQLAADVEYLGTMASALTASSPLLREWAEVLQMSADEAAALPTGSLLRASAAFQAVWPSM